MAEMPPYPAEGGLSRGARTPRRTRSPPRLANAGLSVDPSRWTSASPNHRLLHTVVERRADVNGLPVPGGELISYRNVAQSYSLPPGARKRFQAGVSVPEYTVKLRLTGATLLPEAAARRRARNEGWRRVASLRSRARRGAGIQAGCEGR